MTDEPVLEAEVVDNGHELVALPEHPTTLFRTDDPIQVIEKATAVADALKEVLTKQNLVKRISGKDHVLVEGWTTLGSMLGVVPVVAWTKPLPDDAGWEARVEAKTLDGRVVGAAEAQCLRAENRWKNADDYARRSMAQTRATSKALRGPLGFVVTLAGFSATPAEEMPSGGSVPTEAPGGDAGEAPTSVEAAAAPPGVISEGRAKELRKLFDRSSMTAAHLKLALLAAGIEAPSVNKGLALLTPELADHLQGELERRCA